MLVYRLQESRPPYSAKRLDSSVNLEELRVELCRQWHRCLPNHDLKIDMEGGGSFFDTILGPVIFRDRGKVAEFAELPT